MDATSFTLLAQTAPGLEPLAADELTRLGAKGTVVQGGVRWQGGWRSLIEVNLHSRVATRVLAEVANFPARALGELERKAGLVDWDGRLPPGPVSLRVSASRSRLYHEGAIEERLRTAIGRSPASESEPSSLLVVRVHRDRVTVRLDASGEHLHRRGYRTHTGEAPIRENLAAGALLAAGWDPDSPLMDPFCGSGTIPIEAALIARRIPPGLASPGLQPRGWAFERWPDFDPDLLAGLLGEARTRILPSAPAPILGSDRNPDAVEAARSNAGRAGVDEDVAWAVTSLGSAPIPSRPGWIVTNPPYGGRLGDRRALRPLYSALGGRMRREWAGWGVAFLAADPVLAASTGIPLEDRLRTRNGGLEIHLHVSPPSPPPSPPPDR